MDPSDTGRGLLLLLRVDAAGPAALTGGVENMLSLTEQGERKGTDANESYR